MPSLVRCVVVTAAIAAALGAVSIPGSAQCVGPTVMAPTVAAPGDTITIRGDAWATECNDNVSCTVGCTGEHCEGDEPSPPATDLQVVLQTLSDRNDQSIELATDVDANPRTFAFRVGVSLPDDLRPGRYRVTVGNHAFGWYRSGAIRIVGPADA